MKNIYITLIASLVLSVSAFSQQKYTSSLYQVNGYNINPAYAGLKGCYEGYLQHKTQWVGVEDAPKNNLFQFHGGNEKVGLGVNVNMWNAAMLRSTDIGVTGAYHHSLSDEFKLSGAITLGYTQFGFKSGEAIAFQTDDVVNEQQQNNGAFYGDLGLLLTSDKIKVGFSIPRLFTSSINFETTTQATVLNVERYMMLHGSYNHQFSDKLAVEPTILYRTIPGNGSSIDVFARALYQNVFGFSLGYRGRSGLLAGFDYTHNDMLKFAYNYDAGFSNLNRISAGSHEIMLGITICKEKKEEPEPIVEPTNDYYGIGTLKDNTGNLLANQKVTLINQSINDTALQTTDAEGKIKFLLNPKSTYLASFETTDYIKAEQNLTTRDTLKSDRTFDLTTTPKKVIYFGIITDANTKIAVEGVVIAIDELTAISDINGKFEIEIPSKKIDDVVDYDITFSKKGYAQGTDHLSTTIKDYEPKDLLKELNKTAFVLKPFEQGIDVAKLIDVAPIYFEVGKSEITPEAKVELDKIIKVMNENHEMHIELGAHTDCRGNNDFNLQLSDKRAISCKNYIETKITESSRITGIGYGETKPLSDCNCNSCSDDDHANNRRTEFKIVKMK